MNKIVKFWQLSYTSNPTAFWVEMVSAISVIIGSAILTFTVLDPRPDIFVPFYLSLIFFQRIRLKLGSTIIRYTH